MKAINKYNKKKVKEANSIGLVYKITDLNSDYFYIGSTKKVDDFLNEKYNGSGREWIKYFKKVKNTHCFLREIIKYDLKNEDEMYYFELNEISKYCYVLENNNLKVDESTGCMNKKTTIQPSTTFCPECEGINFHHKKTCSQYVEYKGCSECGSISASIHKRSCSKYKERKVCDICESPTGHKKECPKFKGSIICKECGGKRNHHKTFCSKYKKGRVCEECGHSPHLKTCSRAKEPMRCEERGCLYNNHNSSCSKYRNIKPCSECGGKDGKHNNTCPKAKRCPECNTVNGHLKTCSKYYKNRSDK